MELLPGVSEMCAELSAQGRELVIITNGESRIQRDKVRAVPGRCAHPYLPPPWERAHTHSLAALGAHVL